ncbi:hypothetical protein ACFCYC_18420 [Streptomyces sp. NPDC056402]|uniref:hypothetical protein n=1 Tax=Streptomyces sp. NPDC056402 TaxID=3345810 RepID=UPI0035E20706
MTDEIVEIAEPINLPPAQISAKGTGWVSVLASPEWWRASSSFSNWEEISEAIATAGERRLNQHLCRVMGVTTKRPCAHDTRNGPCEHHGPGNEDNRCGAQTLKGTSCRWNLVVRGECISHPATYQRILHAKAEREEDRRREQAAQEARQAAQLRREEAVALAIACGYCQSPSEAACVVPGTGEAFKRIFHQARYALAVHTVEAQQAACPSCGAQPGVLCQTSSGGIAGSAHVARRRVSK